MGGQLSCLTPILECVMGDNNEKSSNYHFRLFFFENKLCKCKSTIYNSNVVNFSWGTGGVLLSVNFVPNSCHT